MTAMEKFERETLNVGGELTPSFRHKNIAITKIEGLGHDHWITLLCVKDDWGVLGGGEGCAFHSCDDAAEAALEFIELTRGLDIEAMHEGPANAPQTVAFRKGLLQIAKKHNACRGQTVYAEVEMEWQAAGRKFDAVAMNAEINRRMGRDQGPEVQVHVVGADDPSELPAEIRALVEQMTAAVKPEDLKPEPVITPVIKMLLYDLRLYAKAKGYVEITEANDYEIIDGIMLALRAGIDALKNRG